MSSGEISETETETMRYQIITDSRCDFTDKEYASMDVACVPLPLMWDSESHSHFSDENTLKDFYARMRGGLGLFHLGTGR